MKGPIQGVNAAWKFLGLQLELRCEEVLVASDVGWWFFHHPNPPFKS